MRKNESGRSMVEMLGVLAIIGVLSIGGIAGYTLSMRRYRANSIVDAANKYAITVYSAGQAQMVTNQITTLAGFSTPAFNNSGIELPGAVASDVDTMTATLDADGVATVAITFKGDNATKMCQVVGSIAGVACAGTSVSLEIENN